MIYVVFSSNNTGELAPGFRRVHVGPRHSLPEPEPRQGVSASGHYFLRLGRAAAARLRARCEKTTKRFVPFTRVVRRRTAIALWLFWSQTLRTRGLIKTNLFTVQKFPICLCWLLIFLLVPMLLHFWIAQLFWKSKDWMKLYFIVD